jgi:glycosyltransferase involved in cell wall biosynthesis
MKIHVLDPALALRAGHHFHVTLAIRDAAAALGIETTVYGNQAVRPEVTEAMPVRPAFSNTTYALLDVPAELSVAYNHVYGNQTLERELRQSVTEPFAPDDLIVVHTVVSQQLVALQRWYASLPEPRPRICLLLRFQPWFRAAPEDRGLSIAFYERALKLWAGTPGMRVFFATDNRLLGDYYADLVGRPVVELPIPIRHPDMPPAPAGGRGLGLHFAFMGEARLEKGFHLLMGALTRGGLPGLDRVRFTVQATRAQHMSDFIDACRRVLPSVRFLLDDLPERDYLDLLASADAVLVPYDPGEYRLRTSHVFLEALGMGKPVLTTAGTWMDAEMERFGPVGVRAAGFDVEPVAEGLGRLAEGWDAFAAAARAAAPLCRARHNPASFLDAMLSQAERV